MSIGDFLTLATVAAAVLLTTPFLGRYIHRVTDGERVFLSPIVRPIERAIYRVCGVDETAEQDCKGYTIAVLVMAFIAIVTGYAVFRLHDVLPFNEGGIPPMSPDLAFNTSVSFVTNTNWQNYSGETGTTYLTQAAVLAVRNFTSAATGLAVAIALIRGLTGLDPAISPAAAEYQIARVAAARGLADADVRAAVARHADGQLLGFLGEPRVNVLLLNLDLDGLLP